MSKKGMQYDYKEAYNKNLPVLERFHYLENARRDKDSAATFVDPTMASVGIDPQMTFQPPMPSNQIGAAKPVFNPQAQGMAQTIYGTPEQRQISVNTPYMMKSIPEGDKGAGLRALPDNVVENMGYDSATKMLSPLNDNHPGDKKMLKTLTDKPKVTTAYNSSYTGNPNVSNRVYNAATGLTINEDPTYNYKKASQYEANAIQQHGSLEAARKALYNKKNK
jgi:hypothetical protein